MRNEGFLVWRQAEPRKEWGYVTVTPPLSLPESKSPFDTVNDPRFLSKPRSFNRVSLCLPGDRPSGASSGIRFNTMYQGSLTWSRSQLTSGSMNQHAWCPCARVCLVTQSCLTLCNPMDCSLLGSPVHGDSPGKNTWVGCLALLQGIFPTQRSNPGLPHCRQTHYHLSHQGSPWILE